LAIAIPQMMDAVVAQARGQARLMMWLLGIFAGVAVLLASIGIYGAVAYSVEQRTGEIGVRMALGAQTRDVLRLIVNQGMRPVVIGLAIGIVSAFALGRLLKSQLYEVSARNPVLLATSTVLLAAIALIACLVPARRAAHVDPIQALRVEGYARFQIRSASTPKIAWIYFCRSLDSCAWDRGERGDFLCRQYSASSPVRVQPPGSARLDFISIADQSARSVFASGVLRLLRSEYSFRRTRRSRDL